MSHQDTSPPPVPPPALSKAVSRTGWKTPLLAALVVANAALGFSLLGQVGGTSGSLDFASSAQAAQIGRPSEYQMIPASIANVGQDIVYILDTQNGDLTAAAYDRNGGIQFIAPLRLSQLFDAAVGRR